MKLPIDDRLIGCKLFFFLMFYFPAPSARSRSLFLVLIASIVFSCWDCWVVVCPPVLSYGKRSWLSGSVLPIEQPLDLKKAFSWCFIALCRISFQIIVLEVDHISVVTMESWLRAVERAFERSGRYGLRPSDPSDETSTSTYILLSCNQSLLWIVENIVGAIWKLHFMSVLSFCIQKFKANITLLEIEKSCLLVAKHLNKSITRTKYTRPCNKKCLGNLPIPPYLSTPHPNISVKVLSSGWESCHFRREKPWKVAPELKEGFIEFTNRNNKTWSVRFFLLITASPGLPPLMFGTYCLNSRYTSGISGKYDFPLHFFPSADLNRVCLICIFLQAVLEVECCRSSL